MARGCAVRKRRVTGGRDAAAPGWGAEGGTQIKAGEPLPRVQRRWPPRPDLLEHYPDPARYQRRPTMYGLTEAEYRAEAARRLAEGWARWELDVRLPRPAVAA